MMLNVSALWNIILSHRQLKLAMLDRGRIMTGLPNNISFDVRKVLRMRTMKQNARISVKAMCAHVTVLLTRRYIAEWAVIFLSAKGTQHRARKSRVGTGAAGSSRDSSLVLSGSMHSSESKHSVAASHLVPLHHVYESSSNEPWMNASDNLEK